MAYINFADQTMPQLGDEWMPYRAQLKQAGLQELSRPVDVPDVELGVGLYAEVMGNIPNRYFGTMGIMSPAWNVPPSSLSQVTPRYQDSLEGVQFSIGRYMGEGVVSV